MSRATIKDVARLAGVAPSTVSRVLNGHPFVKATMRLRVERAVEQLAYRPSTIARSMRVRRTQLLGMLVRDMTNPDFPMICEAAEAAAQERGYSLLICNSSRRSDKEARYLDLLAQREVDGVMIFVADERVNNLDVVRERGIPLVVVDSELQIDADQVRTDGEQGAYLAARHLMELGHRRVGVLAYSQELLVGRSRLRGCLRAFAESGLAIDPELVRMCAPDVSAAQQATEDLLADTRNRPSALLATSVQLTTGALRAVAQLGLHLPEDLSLVGFDQTELTRQHRPPVTVVARDVPEIGRRAVALLLERIESSAPTAPRTELLPFYLWRGGTTAEASGLAAHSAPITD